MVDPSGNNALLASFFNSGLCQLAGSSYLMEIGDLDLMGVLKLWTRVCDELCPSLTDDDYDELNAACKDWLDNTICALLCGGEKGAKVMKEAYKGLFQRWVEYRRDVDDLDKLERANHENTYGRIQRSYSDEYNSWWSGCRPSYEVALSAELKEFDEIASDWRNKPIKAFSLPTLWWLLPLA
jgi:hypothetical protein